MPENTIYICKLCEYQSSFILSLADYYNYICTVKRFHMISKDNFYQVLKTLGFSKKRNSNIWRKHYSQFNCDIIADLDKNIPIYPSSLDTGDNTSCYFSESHKENYVVFECVNRLLDQGYKPENIYLEKSWYIGHSSGQSKTSHFSPGTKSGRGDITIIDDEGNVILIIECKTFGKKFNEAWKALRSGSDIQIFTYFAQARSTKWLQLYASDYDDEYHVKYSEYIFKCTDDPNVVKLAEDDNTILLYSSASEASDLYKVWVETYKCKTYSDLIFGKKASAYDIGVKPKIKADLKTFNKEDGVANKFAEILRHNSISDKENAFNKLLSLFICKLVDEKEKDVDDVLDFQYKESVDDYYSLYERLLHLFHVGMDKFLKEDVFYLEDSYISNTLNQFTGSNRQSLEHELQTSFKKTKLLSCQVFAFKEIYNEKLFLQNGKILVEVVELFQNYQLSFSSKNQFLGDLFEQLLNKGFKQDEGQFFTPIPITRFMWNSIPFEKGIKINKLVFPKVIDYACGAGHFLTEGISAIASYCQSLSTVEISDETISNSFYGTDIDNRLARVSKVALLLNGANNANVRAINGLSHDTSFLGEENSFDILVANPPYSVDEFKVHLDKSILKKYSVLQYMNDSSDDIENVFVERINMLLKPDGIAAVILPQSILNTDDLSTTKSREIILKNFYIRGIVSLGGKTFGDTNTPTCILFLQRFPSPPERAKLVSDSVDAIFSQSDLSDWEDNEIFASYLENIGVTSEEYKLLFTKDIHLSQLTACEYFKRSYSYYLKDSSIKKNNRYSKVSKIRYRFSRKNYCSENH